MKRVLIVDDESQTVFVTRQRLEHHGYDVVEAMSGNECIERAENDQPDMILLDIMMPGDNGYVTLSKLKENQRTKNIPVMMFSAKSEGEDVQKAIAMGAIDYVTKPYIPEDLIEKVRLLIGES